MAPVLEILDLAETGQLRLSLKTEGANVSSGLVSAAPPVAFRDPLDEADRLEINWYFQEFLSQPFGDARSRATAVETGLRNLGRALFEVVFQGSQAAQNLYNTASADGLENYRLVIVSRRPQFLGMPWELLNEPQAGYLAARLGGIVRATRATSPPFVDKLPTEQLNLLLVAPMPLLNHGASPRILAPTVLKTLESRDVPVQLDVLRPPSLAALAERLSQLPGYYHLVQLDGITAQSPGVLLFEDQDAGPDPVTAARLAAVLSTARVPALLIYAGGDTACLSPNNPSTLLALHDWAATSAQLAQGGLPLVVTMPYPLAASGQELFVQRFYQAFSNGTDIPASVALARRALMDNPHRASAAGRLLLWDWLTPTVYQSMSYSPSPIQKVEVLSPLAPPAETSPVPGPQLPRHGNLGLVGRDKELQQLERQFRQAPVVILTGSTGVGKTELALGFARWLQQTGERSGGIFYTTFEVGAGLERVIHEIGTAVAGLGFADLNVEQRRQWVVDYFHDQPALLIWDGLETAAGFPIGAPGLLDATELAELDSFVTEVARGGRSWVLLVSRRDEPWLSVPHRSQTLVGMDRHDRPELSCRIMEQHEMGSRDLGPQSVECLDLVAGHPLAMQIILPLLKRVPASVLLGELRKAVQELPETACEEGRDTYLTAAMELAFARMSHRSRTHLPFLALFQGRVMLDILSHITQERTYRSVMGEELGWGACRTLLRAARDAGFLEAISPSVYQIHPAFPWFFGRKLQRQLPAAGLRLLEAEFLRVYADTADYFMETLFENQDSATTGVLAEEGNLTQALALALEAKEWDQAQVLVQPLAQVFRMQKRYPELRRLRRELLQSAGSTAAEAEARGATEMWLYLTGTEANEAAGLLELDRAEELNHQLVDYLVGRPGGASDPRTGAVYHQFGIINLHRRRLDEAEQWFRRSLAIIEAGEDRAAVADGYYYLGLVKQHQRYYTEAKEWFGKALEIHQRLQDQEEMIKDYRALGAIAQLRFEYPEAQSWLHRARELLEEFRDEENAIQVYHQLGTVCHAQYLFEDAESWYKQALTLADQHGQQRQMALEFHHLGLLAQTWGLIFEDAEEWYQLAAQKYEELGDWKGVGEEYRQLGVLFHQQKRLEEAHQWYTRAREVFEEIQDLERTASTYGQLGMIAEERNNLSEALERVIRTYNLALEHSLPLLIQVKAHLARLRDKCGQDEFCRLWRDLTGEDPPTDLDVDTSTLL